MPGASHLQIPQDVTLPKLITHHLQVNMAGGRLPVSEDNGMRYPKIPFGAVRSVVW